MGQYRPVPAIYFALLYSLLTNNPFFYHFFQLTLHIADSLLVYVLFSKFLSKRLSFLLCLIFLVHPIQVESVSFIAQTISPLFFLFGILALLLSQEDNISLKRGVIAFTFLLFSLLTKETGFLFLVVIMIYRILFKSKKISLFLTLGSLTLVVYSLIRFTIGKVFFTKDLLVPIGRLNLLDRLINIPAIIFYYLKTFFFPITLVIDQTWIVRKIDFSHFYFPLLIVCSFFIFLIFLGRYLLRKSKSTWRIYIFFLLWFICGLALHLQLFPLDMTVADRWFYFPLVGLLGIIGISFNYLDSLHKKRAIVSSLTLTIIIVLLSLRTVVRNTNWHDAITLYAHDSKTYDNHEIENNLGFEYYSVNNNTEALKHFKKSIELFPYETNLSNAALTYNRMGDYQEEARYNSLALASKSYLETSHSHDLSTYVRAARLLLFLQKPEEVRKVVKAGLQDYPDYYLLWVYLAISEYQLKDQAGALIAAQKVRTLIPGGEADYLYNQILTNQPIPVSQLTP